MSQLSLIIFFLSFLVQFASTAVESRNDPAGEYWRAVMKDQPMPKPIHALIVHHSDSVTPKNSNKKTDCHNEIHHNSFTDDFEPTPNVSAYPDADAELAGTATKDFKPYRAEASVYEGNVGPKAEKKFAQDFEPGPHASRYSE